MTTTLKLDTVKIIEIAAFDLIQFNFNFYDSYARRLLHTVILTSIYFIEREAHMHTP